MKRVQLQPAYVLHRRLYRETSFLIEFFTAEYGRISALARGVRKLKSSTPGLLQPFVPLLISYSGKGELMSLTHIESNGEMRQLQGECLFAGFYLNELLMILLQKWDAHPGLYASYELALQALHSNLLDERALRSFEKSLLEELGYGLLPHSDIASCSIQPDKYYRFIPEHGFVPCDPVEQARAETNIFSGKNLLAYANCNWQDEQALKDAKRLTRLVLAPLLGPRPLFSRQLF